MTTLAILGAGAGLGLATARKFGEAGFDVGLVARRQEKLDGLTRELAGEGVTAIGVAADVRDPVATAAALGRIAEGLGPVDVLVFSPLPSLDWIKPVTETSPEDVRASLELGVVGAVGAVNTVLPGMRRRGHGTVLFTTGGGAIAPKAALASSGITYAAEVAYARMLHETVAADGVHVAHTAIVGALGAGLKHEPSKVAGVLWRQHQDRDAFQTIVD
ncbi:SDR family oxidoreductase [Amycolatopsis sp. cmx-4-68]|uniref:SDR family oxidoreductase n=1 Tax=Amycolatopsis sp. cmx-4-68 TaxID=2790938 RepID=UPI00397943F1